MLRFSNTTLKVTRLTPGRMSANWYSPAIYLLALAIRILLRTNSNMVS